MRIKPGLRKSLWLPNILTFTALGVFILAAYGLEFLLPPIRSEDLLLVVGVVMAFIPALLWMIFFYRQDRHSPEPRGMVLQVFILGGLLAAALGNPLLDLFHLPEWLYTNPWVTLFGAILIVGFSQEFLKYAAVRFSVYNSAEFDEHTDGILYAVAAGLGYATVLNINFILDSGVANLGLSATRIVITALAQASFAGVMGYFLSIEKLDKTPSRWMPLGLTCAAVLNGLFFFVWGTLRRASISTAGGVVSPWFGLVLAAILAGGTLFVLTWLIQRDQRAKSAEEEVSHVL
ncbi:MAG: PrsW family intramembrane metalloprotease [Anaerolineaceae bacterium]|nr:PrsW family intramembrane metalloprotease [Anaerolineaceae bacterium]